MTRAQSRLPHIVTHEVKILTTQSTVSWPVSFWLFFARQTKVQSEPHGSLCTFTALNSNWIVTFHQQLKIEDVFLWDVIAVERDFHFSLNRVFDIAWDLNRNTLKLNTVFTSIPKHIFFYFLSIRIFSLLLFRSFKKYRGIVQTRFRLSLSNMSPRNNT